MFNIGTQELLIILLLVFILFGPKQIPEVARKLGRGVGDLERALRGMEDHVRRASEEVPRLDEPEASPPRMIGGGRVVGAGESGGAGQTEGAPAAESSPATTDPAPPAPPGPGPA